jgi:uncharacterized protein YbjT (DUF2867 family)
MKIALFGATGLTGSLVLHGALARGDEVVALVRNPDMVNVKHPRLTVQKGSPVCLADVETCVRGADVVVHCLGIGGKGDGQATTLISTSVALVLEAMSRHGVPRVICMSNIGAGDSGTWFANRVVIPVFLRWLRPIIEDKNLMEAALRASNVAWVSVRLPSIVEGTARTVRVSTNGRGLSLRVTAGTVADFLLAQTHQSEFLGSTPSISN